ncbi:hypothetical protein TDB9533_03562 [Thalassocella blandensis]|nr:hypothetical protein TDB9533_03562 [Thalassocella blandensis]
MEILAVLEKSHDAQIRVTRDSYMGREVVDIRVWVKRGEKYSRDPDRWVRTQKGLTFSAHKLPALIKLLVESSCEKKATTEDRLES